MKKILATIHQKKRRPAGKSGMTLLEVLIYMAILVVILGAIIQTVLLLTTHYRAVRNTRDIEDSAIAVLDRLVRTARSADDIVMSSAIGSSTPSGTDPSTISLIANDLTTGFSTTTTFTVDQTTKRVILYENGIYLGPITKESVSVIGFKVTHIINSNAKALRVELSLLSDQATPAVISKNFYDTVVLRGTYR
jgi:type II secretory pathway pseudopilin PulG